MLEISERSHLFIPVSKKLIGDGSLIYTPKENISQSILEKTTRLDQETAQQIESLAIPPEGSLKAGTEEAIQWVNNLKTEIGLPLDKKLKVIYLDEAKFNEKFPEKLGGISVSSIRLNVVKLTTKLPNYVLASVALHELIHSEFETAVTVYHIDPNYSVPDYPERIYRYMRRIGLERRQLDLTTNTNIKKGELLNEIANYKLQADFIKKALCNKDTYGNELEVWNQGLKIFHDNPDEIRTMKVDIISDSKSYSVRIDWDKLLVDNDGKLLLSGDMNMISLYLQLADSLSRHIGTIDGEPFTLSLLKAKIEPRRIHSIRRGINEKMGYDFFSKLLIPLDNVGPQILGLLEEVQAAEKNVVS